VTDLTFDIEPEFRDVYEPCKASTMTSLERMHALWLAVRHISRARLEGDIVECGVWRGGSMMLAAKTLLDAGDSSRTLWLYDTFEGMTEPTELDVQSMSGRDAAGILATEARTTDNPFWAIAQLDIVEQNMLSTGYPTSRIRYVQGKVEETLPAQMPDRIALLRLDTDWYESTRHELEHLWPRLVTGGVLIIDDYGYWQGARRAVDEFLSSLDRPPLLNRIDYTGRIAVKV